MFRLAYVLLFPLLTYQFMVQASDSPNIFLREDPPPSCVDGCSKRTLFNIIWGCLSTTIICAWAALHPNIPPSEGPLKGALRRIELMFWTILAPEILPCWALNQRLAAMTVRDIYNEAKGYKQDGIWKTFKGWFSWSELNDAANPAWTLKHGHFLIMGGIHLVEPAEPEVKSTSSETPTGMEQAVVKIEPRASSFKPDTEKGESPAEIKPKPKKGRVTILTLEMLEVLVHDPEFEIEVTEAEIARTSKGDGLSKMIFILQSSWFIIQCIARRVQGLDLTQLELTTLALASLNGITFILWWDKPLGAQTIVRVYLKRKLTDEERHVEGKSLQGHSWRSRITPTIQELFKGRLTTPIRDVFQRRGVLLKWILFPFAILGILLFPIVPLGIAFVFTIIDLAIGGSTSCGIDATHVPTFYVPKHQHSKYIHLSILLLSGTIFGSIHLAGWNLPFPTYEERKLWRIASLGVTIIPFGAVPFGFIIAAIVVTLCCACGNDLFGIVAIFMPALSAVAYACARLILLGQALALLRHLPPTAFTTVDWSQFYPHFF